MKHINENGRSMVEMLGVLAIIGVLSVGGIAGYSKAMNKYKINKTTDQVSMLVANIRTLFSSQGNYQGLNNGQAIKFGVVPEDMIEKTDGAATGNLKNAFGGEVVIAASGGRQNGDGEAFNIVYSGLSAEACVTIATGDWGSGQSSGLIAIAAGASKNSTSGATTSTGEDDEPITTQKGVDAVLLGVSTDQSVAGSSTSAAIAIPGGNKNPTPMSVTNAVNACACTGTNCEVAWKYY